MVFIVDSLWCAVVYLQMYELSLQKQKNGAQDFPGRR